MRKMKSNLAFTLIEMLMVVVIIGALTALAIPSYTIQIERVRASEGVQSLTALLGSQKRYQLENSAYATTLAAIDIDIAASNNFNVPTVANNAAAVASIIRRDITLAYTMSISSTGVVSCVSDAVCCNPADICTKIGY